MTDARRQQLIKFLAQAPHMARSRMPHLRQDIRKLTSADWERVKWIQQKNIAAAQRWIDVRRMVR